MDSVADKNGFAVCYPQGSSVLRKQSIQKKGLIFGMWVMKYIKMKQWMIYFLKSLAVFLQQKYNLNPEKTFCAGMSNGGDLSYLLACEAPDIFKGIATITGCMMGFYNSCSKNDPVPVFSFTVQMTIQHIIMGMWRIETNGGHIWVLSQL